MIITKTVRLPKFEGMDPVRKLWERSTSVIEGMVEISQGIIPVSELRLRLKLMSFSQ